MKRHEYHFFKRARLTAILIPISLGLAFLTPTIYNGIFPKQKADEASSLREGYSIRGLYSPNKIIFIDGTATNAAYDSIRTDSSTTKRAKPAKNLLDKVNPKAMR